MNNRLEYDIFNTVIKMSKYKINILDESRIFNERENGIIHTPYELETAFLSGIKKGSRTDVKMMINNMIDSGINIGKMSNDGLRQIKYWAVSLFTLITRSAIQGGLDETTAYNFSDNCIMRIDKMSNTDDIVDFIIQKCITVTDMVAESRENSVYSQPIRKCLHYIHTHLHERLDVATLSKECGLSEDYLSYLFKKNIGINLSKYIKTQKLQASKEMLKENYSVSDIAYYLGFCSESYFISCFKKEFGKTPKQFRNNIAS